MNWEILKTKKKLKEAVKLWCKNKKEAIKKYGDINTWYANLVRHLDT